MNLRSGKIYCVKFYVNIMNTSTQGNDGFAVYFGGTSIDTIKKTTAVLSFLNPQVKCLAGSPIVDTLGWQAVTGTFVATGSEKYAVIGIFSPNNQLTTPLINPTNLPLQFTDACIDDVSCIEMNCPAYAGPDKWVIGHDSAYIGRESDFAVDPYCFWYKLPNMSTAIDTVSGRWVKPTSTSTYVVRQELECNTVKWDTVVVYVDPLGVRNISSHQDISIFPNPANEYLLVSETPTVKFVLATIVNNLNQKVREEEIDLNNPTLRINIQNLPQGIYFLRLLGTEGNKIELKFAICR
jgi:hypothetical protein